MEDYRVVRRIAPVGMLLPVRGQTMYLDVTVKRHSIQHHGRIPKVRAFALIVETHIEDLNRLTIDGFEVFSVEVLILPDQLQKVFPEVHKKLRTKSCSNLKNPPAISN